MGYDYYGYDNLGSSLNHGIAAGVGVSVWLIIALILSLVGCFLIYFMFVKKGNKLKNNKLEWLRSFLRFDKMLIETILKIAYIFTALLITLESFGIIGTSFISFLILLIGGNIIARVAYEASMILISIWQNTRDINKKLK